MSPNPRGRVLAALIGLSVGAYFALDAMSDYQLIQRLDDPNERDENGEPIKRKLNVQFKPTSPLKLKPEAEERLHRQRELQEQKQAEQSTNDTDKKE